MKQFLRRTGVTLAFLFIAGANLVGCSEDYVSHPEYGRDLTSGVQYVYAGNLGIHAFEKAVVFTNYTGDSLTIPLKNPSPHQPAAGTIGKFYNDNPGQHKACGTPLEGEHLIFNDEYRVHIFGKAVVVWRKYDEVVQSVICEAKFRP